MNHNIDIFYVKQNKCLKIKRNYNPIKHCKNNNILNNYNTIHLSKETIYGKLYMHAQICKYFDSIARPFHWLFVVPYGSGQSLQDLLLWFAHCHSLIGGILHSIMGNVVFPPEIPILNRILSRWNNANWWFQQKHLPSINNLVAHSRTVLKGLWVIDINQFPSEENEWSFYFRDLIAHYCRESVLFGAASCVDITHFILKHVCQLWPNIIHNKHPVV